jgi:hypothetical protein
MAGAGPSFFAMPCHRSPANREMADENLGGLWLTWDTPPTGCAAAASKTSYRGACGEPACWRSGCSCVTLSERHSEEAEQ